MSSISELLKDVEVQKEERNVIYDADGIVYLSCYKHRESDDIELMYADFFMRIHSIETELWKSYQIKDTLISITPKKSFRDTLTKNWKADRKPKDEKELTDKQLEAQRVALELKTQVSKVKALLAQRMANSILKVNAKSEADDICVDYSKQGWLVVAMDSDVIHQSRTPVFNYHKKHWKWVHQGNDEQDIFQSIVKLTIVGGHNGDFGVKGKGKVFAENFISDCMNGDKEFNDWIDLFETPADALMNFRLADCGQVHNGKVTLDTIESIADGFKEYMVSPF